MALAFAKATVPQEKFTEIGRSGLKHWGGILEDEFLRELRGEKGVRIYREMSRNDGIIGASLFAYTVLAKGASFRVDSARQGDAKADEVAAFIRGALFEDMSIAWPDLLSEIFSFLTYGWSWFEVVYKQRGGDGEDPTTRSRFNDNRIGWRKWALRAQDTLLSWDLDSAGGVTSMVQSAAPTYERVPIPIAKSLLFRTSSMSPEGVSILRTAYQAFYFKRRIQIVRGIGIERDLAGLPKLTPPQGVDVWNPNDANAVALKAQAEQIVRNIRRDEQEGVLLPFGWTLELLASSGSRQFDITEVIAQFNAEIVISMMTDFLLVGHENVGARSMREDARDTFSKAASSFLDSICEVINRFAITPLVKLNGWAQELTPKLAHGPVAEIALADLVNYIEKTSAAGLLFPDVDLEKHLRARAQLPPPPEDRPALPTPEHA